MINKRDEILPKPELIKTPIEELEVLAAGSDTTFFVVLKRVARRYAEQLRNLSFTLDETDPHFVVKHTRYVEQAIGMNLLIKIVNDAKKELAQAEGDKVG